METSTPNYQYRWDLSPFINNFNFDEGLTSEDCLWKSFDNDILSEFLNDLKDT